MVRRSGVLTGIGNPSPEIMDGKSTGVKALDGVINQCAKDCYSIFFKGTEMDYAGIDAGYRQHEVRLGVEPAYFGDNLKLVTIHEEKRLSSFTTGHAFDMYGSGVRSTVRRYQDYKRSTKFTRFVDKWHPKLFLEATNLVDTTDDSANITPKSKLAHPSNLTKRRTR